MPATPLKSTSLLTLLLAAATPAAWSASTPAEIDAKVATLESQLQALQAELAQMRATAAAAAAAPAPVPAGTSADAGAAAETARLSWFGYGELSYARPAEDPAQARIDVARFVLGAGYRFDDRTRMQSELELEHAVASADDAGEIEVEQLYIEHDLSANLRTKLGLFLIPSGLLNENHEPTRYYGVFRNNVETAIIPTTWREGGIGLQGDTHFGLRWDVGITTGVDLSKWDATSDEGAESPLGSIHQELVLARAADFSGYVAANYTGVAGLRLGASVFTGGAGQRQPGFSGNRLTLWETHARWQPGPWDFAALYAHGHIGNTAPENLALVGNPTLIPEDFFGWYLQAAWRGLAGRAWLVTPFLRYERFNTASGYANLGAGLTPVVQADRKAVTGGLQMEFAPSVIVKLDYVDFADGKFGDRLDVGLGYEF